MTESDLLQLLGALGLADRPTEPFVEVPAVGTVYAVSMAEERSFDRWREALDRGAALGYTAVGVGSDQDLEYLREHCAIREEEGPADIDDLRAAAQRLDGISWLEGRRALFEDEVDWTIPRGPWPEDVAPAYGLHFPFDERLRHLDPWWMILLPTPDPTEVPLLLRYGGWNDCPDAPVHTALLRHWRDRHGAQLAGIGVDRIEFLVERPPSTREAALELAMEHYLYCTDVVDQGWPYDTVERCAARLLDGRSWFFWWD
jgi:hypothetical protein